jgi:cbb3-type cytochrome oxidase subunit 3
MWFTRLWFDYAPMYNKFRTVSMALIVLQVTLPMLGFYVLDRILKAKYETKRLTKAGFIAFGITAGFCLLCVLMPGIAGTFTGSSDAGMNEIIVDALVADRATLLKKDAIRSIFFISCVFALILWAFRKAKNENATGFGNKTTIVAAAVIVLVWIDLAGVGKRYLNKEHFVTPKDFSAHYEPRVVDEIIHQDEDPNYRVLDLSVNTFNDAIQSYHHKCIGGYSPVKLQRYQDLIDRYIAPEIREFYGAASEAETISDIENTLPELKVVSMLNGKYIIVDPSCSPVQNQFAYGNCWFVDNYVPAATPNEEIDQLAWTDLRTTAVIGKDFLAAQKFFDNSNGATNDSTDVIELVHYAPNELRYAFKTSRERAAIFSEIYYPKGWKAYIAATGEPVELFRANWMLRGAIIPKGEGELVMRFEPESYAIGANISRASSILLILLLIASVAGVVILERKQQN